MMKTLTILLAIAALSTQAAIAGQQDKHPNQAVVPQRAAPREAAPRQFAPREAAPRQFAPRQFAPRQVERVQPAPVMRERAMPTQPRVMRERAMPEVPVRGENSAAAAVWRDQHQGIFHERGIRAIPVRGDNSAAAAVWRDQHASFVRQSVVFERFHPRRVMFVNPVWVMPTVVTPQIITPQFVMPVVNVAPVSYIYTGFVPTYVPAIGYTPAFAAVPMFDTAYTSYVNVAPIVPFAAYSGDCDDEDDNCYAPSYVNYVQPAYTYVGPAVNPFGNAQLQGVVIGQTGNNLIVLAPNLQPVFVNTGIAEQAGFIQGDVAPGSVINALGYYTGNEFIATSLV